MADSRDQRKLESWERFVLATIGVLLVACSAVAWIYPVSRVQAVAGSTEAKVFVVSADPTFLVLTLVGFGAAFILLAMNGLRITRAKAWNVELGTDDPKESAKKVGKTGAFRHPPSPVPAVNGSSIDGEQEVPPSPPATVWIDNEEYGVYSLKDVRTDVVQDLVLSKEWQERGYGALDVEFVARRSGRGNHAWAFKFRDRDSLWWVSHGGRGKDGATVTITSIPPGK